MCVTFFLDHPCKPACPSGLSEGDWLRLIKNLHTLRSTRAPDHAAACINNSPVEVRFWAFSNELKASRRELNKPARAPPQRGPTLARAEQDSKCLPHRVSIAEPLLPATDNEALILMENLKTWKIRNWLASTAPVSTLAGEAH